MQPINTGAARSDLGFDLPGACFVLDDVLDRAACARWIRRTERVGFARTAGDYPPSYRDNDRLVIDDRAAADALFARVRPHLPPRIHDAAGRAWVLGGLNERFRVCRYTNGQCFRIHRDGAHAPSARVRSFLTLQIYLNDAAEITGGATRFFASRAGGEVGAIRPKRGAAAVFAHDLWHDGEAVTAGTKYVLRTDVMYVDAAGRDGEAPEATTLRDHAGYVFAIAPLDGGGFASASRDRTVRVWERDDATFRCARVLSGHAASVTGLVEPSPGTLWSGSRDRTIRAWDTATGASRAIGAHDGSILALAALGPDAIGSAGADAVVRLWTRGGAANGALVGHAGWVWAIAPIAEGYAVSGSEDGTLRLWHLPTRAALDAAAPGRGPVHAVAFVRDGLVAAGFADGFVVLYRFDPASRRLAPVGVIEAHRGEVYALAAIDGAHAHLVSGGEDDRARVHRLADGARVADIAHDGFVRAVAPLGDGRIASGGYDEAVRIWSAPR
jgi:hypothetical protein